MIFSPERLNKFELPKLLFARTSGHGQSPWLPFFAVAKKRSVFVLLAQRRTALETGSLTDNPEELAISYKREALRNMCREAGIWRSGNKRALSAGLLNWRDRCRAQGQAFLVDMRSLAKNRPQQLSFRF
jgi:hypothetical protein